MDHPFLTGMGFKTDTWWVWTGFRDPGVVSFLVFVCHFLNNTAAVLRSADS